MSIMDEMILDVDILDEIKFVASYYVFAFYYMCSLLALCVVF